MSGPPSPLGGGAGGGNGGGSPAPSPSPSGGGAPPGGPEGSPPSGSPGGSPPPGGGPPPMPRSSKGTIGAPSLPLSSSNPSPDDRAPPSAPGVTGLGPGAPGSALTTEGGSARMLSPISKRLIDPETGSGLASAKCPRHSNSLTWSCSRPRYLQFPQNFSSGSNVSTRLSHATTRHSPATSGGAA